MKSAVRLDKIKNNKNVKQELLFSDHIINWWEVGGGVWGCDRQSSKSNLGFIINLFKAFEGIIL